MSSNTAIWKDAFDMFDQDGDGSITAVELESVLKKLGVGVTKAEAKMMLDDVDTDGDGSIDLQEFITMMDRRMTPEEEETEMLKAFHVFDRNGDGFIDIDELKHIMYNMGETITDEEASVILKMADTNGDGRVDYGEFVKIMLDMTADVKG